MIHNKTLLITGGTGSFGNAVLKRFLHTDHFKEIRIFSRDEKKQDDMRKKYNSPKLKFYIGDVRDFQSVSNVVRGVDFIFHAAALKQVPSCEFFPMQAVATNVSGSSNVLDCAIRNDVKGVVCLSSDKAVYPINAMGMTKALMEKVAQSFARNYPESRTKIAITRYGNVMMSRGSVIPLFLDQIRQGKALTITDPKMTRFMMSLGDSVDLVKFAFANASSGDLFVKKAPACTVETLAKAITRLMGVEGKVQIQNIGTRHGEKLYESLVSREEIARAEDLGEYYRIPADSRDLNYDKYFVQGEADISKFQDYTSHNTRRLNIEQVKDVLKGLTLIREAMHDKA